MSARIGEARFDENGHTSYGEPGDQTTEEVKISDFYINEKKPWTKVFRAKSEIVRQKLALAMTQACQNDNIGYAQYGDGSTVYRDRYGLYFALKKDQTIDKVSTPCNCDCSSLVAQCCRAAGIDVSIYMSTSNEPTVLMNTGEFDQLNFERGMTLITGDIMWRQGHTGIITQGDDQKQWSKDPKWVGAATENCNVYSSNSTSSPLLPTYPKLNQGNLVDVCDWDSNFYYVRIAAKYYGFVEQKYMQSVTPAFEEFFGRATTQVNLRQGPGVAYPTCNIDRGDGKGVRHYLYQGEIVKVISTTNGWYQTAIDNGDGTVTWTPWVNAKYIEKVEVKVPKIGDKVILKGDILYTTKAGLEGTITGISDGNYLIALSDGCVGYSKDIELK